MARAPSARTTAPWAKIAPLGPELTASPRGGLPPIPPRSVFDGIRWGRRRGVRWPDVPAGSPMPSMPPTGSLLLTGFHNDPAEHVEVHEVGEKDTDDQIAPWILKRVAHHRRAPGTALGEHSQSALSIIN
jgi:hypothetical protein